MTSFKRPLRIGALAGASILALTLAMPVMANDMSPASGNTTYVPQSPDVGGGYRPDPTRKTVGEMERDIAEGKYNGSTAPARAGDMNKLGETGTGQPVQSGTQFDSAPTSRPISGQSGDMNRPANTTGNYGARDSNGAFPSEAANLKVQSVRVQDLPPDLQAAVNSRMDRRQNASELVETTILNRLALMGSEFKLDSAQQVGNNYVLRVSSPSGQQATMLYETNSDTLREVQM